MKCKCKGHETQEICDERTKAMLEGVGCRFPDEWYEAARIKNMKSDIWDVIKIYCGYDVYDSLTLADCKDILDKVTKLFKEHPPKLDD